MPGRLISLVKIIGSDYLYLILQEGSELSTPLSTNSRDCTCSYLHISACIIAITRLSDADSQERQLTLERMTIRIWQPWPPKSYDFPLRRCCRLRPTWNCFPPRRFLSTTWRKQEGGEMEQKVEQGREGYCTVSLKRRRGMAACLAAGRLDSFPFKDGYYGTRRHGPQRQIDHHSFV